MNLNVSNGTNFNRRLTRMGAHLFAVIAVWTLCFAQALSAHGQTITASVQGSVADGSGAVVTGASVEATNTATGVVTRTTSNAIGRFVFASLQPGGPYTITVTASGFKTEVRSGIHLNLNQVAEIPIVLQIGTTTQKIEVTADATQLEASEGAIGQVIGNRSIENLPLNQRNVYSLVFLMPGVNGTVTAQYNSGNFSVNGGRPGTTAILVDGIPASPPVVNPINGFAVFPSVDAVQEFKVQTTNYSAEFGRSGSGVINIILKSGANQLHGSLYEFLRNSDLDSNTFFAKRAGTPLPHFERSQFGGSLNGPVILPKLYDGQDKTFFLFSYEGLRQGTQSEGLITVPTALQRTGDFSQTENASCQNVVIYDPNTAVLSGSNYLRTAFPGNVIPSSRIDPVAKAIMNYYPLPNLPGTPCSATSNFFGVGVSQLNIDTYDAKVDEVINAKNRFFVRYSRRNLTQDPVLFFPQAQRIGEGGAWQPQISNSGAFDYTFTPNPNMVIEIPFGFSRTLLNFQAESEGFNPSTELGFPSYIASNADHLLFPLIQPGSYATLGDGAQGQTRHSGFDIFAGGVNATQVLGKHVLKFGGTGWLMQANDDESGFSTGQFAFSAAITQGPNANTASSTAGNSIASMLLGIGSSGEYEINSDNAATTSEYYGMYFQDDWKVRSRLTLNIGLRYDLEVPRVERHNRMNVFDPTVSSPLASTTGITTLTGGLEYAGVNSVPRRQFNPQWNNYGPRFGFSYELNSKTQVRGGYGLFYGPSLREASTSIGTEGYSATTSYTGSANGINGFVYLSNPFPTGINQPSGNSQGLFSGIGQTFSAATKGDNKVGYTQNWNINIQRQLPFDLLIEAAYVGSHGVHLNNAGTPDWNRNQLSPAQLSLGTGLQKLVTNPFYGIITTGPEAGATIAESYLLQPYPQFTTFDDIYPSNGYEIYHSFQLKVNKRLSHNLNALVSFTGGKLIDDYAIIVNVGNNPGAIQNIYNIRGERSVSTNDISRSFVASVVYSLPFGRGQAWGANWNRPLDLILGGWQIEGITEQADGFPLAMTTQNSSQSGSNVLRPNVTGVSPFVPGGVKSKLNNYINKAAFTQPAAFTFGDASRTFPNCRAPGNHNIDFSGMKNFHLTEKIRMELRGEAFNLLNQVVFAAPNTTFSATAFGQITGTLANTNPRQIQGALKIVF